MAAKHVTQGSAKLAVNINIDPALWNRVELYKLRLKHERAADAPKERITNGGIVEAALVDYLKKRGA